MRDVNQDIPGRPPNARRAQRSATPTGAAAASAVVRSNLALTRLVGVPYGALLALYLTVIGGGGSWLHGELRAIEAEVEIERLLVAVDPIVERLSESEGLDAARRPEPVLLAEIAGLIEDLAALETMSLRDAGGGWIVEASRGISSAEALPRVRAIPGEEVMRAEPRGTPVERLLGASDNPWFTLRFDLAGGTNGPARFDVSLRRDALLEHIDGALSRLRRALAALAIGGTIGIALAALITAHAMRATRRLESHFLALRRRPKRARACSRPGSKAASARRSRYPTMRIGTPSVPSSPTVC